MPAVITSTLPQHCRNANSQKAKSVCKFWAENKCRFGDRCRFLHSWLDGDHVSIVANLQGHKKEVTGIAYPSGGDKLYSGSTDGTLRVWNCHSGKCDRVINLGAEIGCLISHGPCIFIGLPNVVKVWNTENGAELSLDGPKGQVHALIFEENALFAGTQSGQVLAWKVAGSDGTSTNPFEAVATVEAQTHGIVCLVVKDKKLFSGSINGTIKVTDITTLKSLMSLRGHSNSAVTSMIFWGGCLLSSSLDGTVNAWRETGNGLLQICYTHQQEKGVIALTGMNIDGTTPGGARRDVLLVSCIDNCIRIYELPSFKEMGRVYAKKEVRALRAEDGLGGLFFAGDGSGRITIGKMA